MTKKILSILTMLAFLGFLFPLSAECSAEPNPADAGIPTSPEAAGFLEAIAPRAAEGLSLSEKQSQLAREAGYDPSPYSTMDHRRKIENIADSLPSTDKKRIDNLVFSCISSPKWKKSCIDASRKSILVRGDRSSEKKTWGSIIYFLDRVCRKTDAPEFCKSAEETLGLSVRHIALKKQCLEKKDGEACYELSSFYGTIPGTSRTPPVFPSKERFAKILEEGCRLKNLDSCIVGALAYQKMGRYYKMGDLSASACKMGDGGSCLIAAGIFDMLSLANKEQNPKLASDIGTLSERLYRKACDLGQKAACRLLEKRKIPDRKSLKHIPNTSVSTQEEGD